MLVGILVIVLVWVVLVLIYVGGDLLGQQGYLWLLVVLVLVWVVDLGVYFVGCYFGKYKLVSWISFNKIWEGLFGGLLVGVVVVFGLGWLVGIDVVYLFGLLIIVVVVVFVLVLGDLFESLIKCYVGVKDLGYLILGYGGVFDWVDGVFVVVLVFVLGKEIFGF